MTADAKASGAVSKAAKLRRLLARPGLVIVPEAPSPQMARLAEAVGHECLYIGGGALSRWHLVLEDWGLIQQSELADHAGKLAEAVSIPFIADADQGGETPLNTWRSVRDFERAGVAGIHIEDSVNPKYIDNIASAKGRRIEVPRQEMLERIHAAVEARRDPDLVIIARTDILYHASGSPAAIEEAIERAHAFKEAGADVFMPVGMTGDLVSPVTAQSPLPVLGLSIPRTEAEGTALKISMFQTHDPLIALFEKIAIELKEEGTLSNCTSPKFSLAESVESSALRKIAERWFRIDGRYQ